MEIRDITPADDRMAISRIYEENWKYAYKRIVPQHSLDSILRTVWFFTDVWFYGRAYWRGGFAGSSIYLSGALTSGLLGSVHNG